MLSNSRKNFLGILEIIVQVLLISWIFFSICELIKIGFTTNYFNPHILLVMGIFLLMARRLIVNNNENP